MAPHLALSPRCWNGARLCRRPAAARGKFEGVGSLPRAAAGRGRHSRAPFPQRGERILLKYLSRIEPLNRTPEMSNEQRAMDNVQFDKARLGGSKYIRWRGEGDCPLHPQ